MVSAYRRLLLVLVLSSTTALSVLAQPGQCANEPDLDRWVLDLGHDQYLRREKASRKLIAIGAPAITPLVAAMRLGDLEVIERAIEVITEIGLSQKPNEDGGAWEQLSLLAHKGSGQTASRAEHALAELRSHRSQQARIALKAAGIFVGVDEFVVRSFNQHRMIVRVDDAWDGEVRTLHWLRWLYRIENARVKGNAVSREVLSEVVKIPDLKSVAIVDGIVDRATLEPLLELQRITSLEFRYVALQDEFSDLLASLPIRTSLELMGTGISEEVVESMRQSLQGLQIIHRQGGFLGVQCLDTDDVCEISKVVLGSAAQKAGLMPGDIIVQVGDAPVRRFRDLQSEINQHVPGDDLEVKFRRGGQVKDVRLELGKFEDT